MTWNMRNGEETVNLPPSTEHEKEAMKKAKENIVKELQEEAETTYETRLRTLKVTETSLKRLQKEKEESMKELGITQEELNKLM